jgi:uncharacterized protein YyaL (SSP411 family)
MNFSDKDYTFIDYLFAMTDDTGIFQHSIYGVPDPRHGYTTDDNARALILAVLLLEKFKDKKYLKLVYNYMEFLLFAQNENGMFKNFMGYDREFLEDEGSEDSFGRSLVAVCRTSLSKAVPENIKKTCQYIINKTLVHLPKLKYPRPKAYAIVGLSCLTESAKTNEYVELLSNDLADLYRKNKDDKWHWFENIITYGNSYFPRALMIAYKMLKKDELLKIAEESMEFLAGVTIKEEYFKPIGCDGWYKKGKKAAEFDEQPIEACETMLLYLDCYEITKDKKYLDYAVKCYNWYTGVNSMGVSLIDSETGACYDGICPDGLNLNQGSESIISYGTAFMEISKRVKLITKSGHWIKKDLY